MNRQLLVGLGLSLGLLFVSTVHAQTTTGFGTNGYRGLVIHSSHSWIAAHSVTTPKSLKSLPGSVMRPNVDAPVFTKDEPVIINHGIKLPKQAVTTVNRGSYVELK